MIDTNNTARWEFVEVISYTQRRRWVWREERHVTYRRARRGPYRGRVQALIQDAQGRRL